MNDWKKLKWGDIATLEYGKALQEYQREDGQYPVYGTNGKIGTTDTFLCSFPGVIVGRKGAYRGVHFSKTPFYVIDTAFYIKPKIKELDLLFAYYQLLTVNINFMDSGSAIPSTSREDFYDIDIVLPPIEQQKRISALLASLDDKIDLLHRQNKTLKHLAETLFRQWFIEEEDADWKKKKIGDEVTVKGGTTPRTDNPEFWNGNINWTTPRDLSNHHSVYLTDTNKKITELGLKEIGSGLLPIGTVLLSSRAPIGYLAITEIPVAINQGYIAIICNKKLSNYFIFCWTKYNLDTILGAANGSVFQEISKSTFKHLEITIPPDYSLNKFNNIVALFFNKIKLNTVQISTLSRLRDLLLPKLMSGQ